MNGLVLPSPAAGGFRALDPVPADAEFERIRRLPRRRWTPEAMSAAAEQLTPMLLNAKGLELWNGFNRDAERTGDTARRDDLRKQYKIHLMPIQAAFLTEAYHMRGGFGALPVGSGKSLIAWCVALLFDGWRTALFVPGGLKAPEGSKRKGKTEHDFSAFAQYWREPKLPIRLVGYEFCALEQNADYLEQLDASVLFFDECDFLRNLNSGRTRRTLRHLIKHPEKVSFFVTGSMQRRSLGDYAHMVSATLRERAPVPITWHVLDTWKSALDYAPRDGIRRRPGALLQLAADVGIQMPSDDNPDSAYETACAGYYHRLADTPGVILWGQQSCDKPIRIRILKPPDDPTIEKAFYNFRATQCTPDGYDVSSNFSKARHGQELASGFYNRPKVPPPEEWKEARREYHAALREAIAESGRRGHHLDTPTQAANFIHANPTSKWHEAVTRWAAIEPSYEWVSEPVWLSASVLTYAAEWARANSPAIIWVRDIAVGEALSLMTGLPYFGPGGRDSRGRLIDNFDPNESAIVSIKSSERGRNLQGWNRCLVFAPPESEIGWEQAVLGRIHRQGQEREVNCDVLVSSADSLYSLNRACSIARDVQRKEKLTHKILSAAWDWSTFPAWAANGALLAEDDPRRSRWVFV